MRGRNLLPLSLVALLLLSTTAPPGRSSHVAAKQQEPAAPPAQQLIAAAVQSGQIDYETSLVYRAFALFGDSRLPDEFGGSGSLEDNAFFAEAKLNWDKLTPSTRDQLTPFIVRPTDPRSIFAAEQLADAASGETRQTADQSGDVACVDDWATAVHPTYPLKIWMRCTGDDAGDLNKVLSIVDEYWQVEVGLMGLPKEDTGTAEAGGDTRLDLYVLDVENDLLPRDGGTQSPLNQGTLAMAIADDPIVGKTASGYMIARRASIDDEIFHPTLAHEFFHVLQYAHNVTVTWGFSGTPYGEFEVLHFTPYWFFEATATWVETYVYRGKISDQTMKESIHGFFVHAFHYDEPIYTSVERDSPMALQIYAAYIWFMFVQQELGAEAIGQIWRNLESVGQDDFDGTLAAIDAVLPFAAHFRDFAVRNLNLDLQPGDPISPSYKDFDPSFPEGVRPRFTVGEGRDRVLETRSAAEPVREIPDTIKPLSAHYDYFVPKDDVTGITLDFSGMTPTGTLDVDLIVKIQDKGWERRQLPAGEPTTLCRSDPADHIQGFYLVLSNHARDTEGALGGSFTIDTSPATCA